jgi:hypothetical protein
MVGSAVVVTMSPDLVGDSDDQVVVDVLAYGAVDAIGPNCSTGTMTSAGMPRRAAASRSASALGAS